jgi:hypothetical protein
LFGSQRAIKVGQYFGTTIVIGISAAQVLKK